MPICAAHKHILACSRPVSPGPWRRTFRYGARCWIWMSFTAPTRVRARATTGGRPTGTPNRPQAPAGSGQSTHRLDTRASETVHGGLYICSTSCTRDRNFAPHQNVWMNAQRAGLVFIVETQRPAQFASTCHCVTVGAASPLGSSAGVMSSLRRLLRSSQTSLYRSTGCFPGAGGEGRNMRNIATPPRDRNPTAVSPAHAPGTAGCTSR